MPLTPEMIKAIAKVAQEYALYEDPGKTEPKVVAGHLIKADLADMRTRLGGSGGITDAEIGTLYTMAFYGPVDTCGPPPLDLVQQILGGFGPASLPQLVERAFAWGVAQPLPTEPAWNRQWDQAANAFQSLIRSRIYSAIEWIGTNVVNPNVYTYEGREQPKKAPEEEGKPEPFDPSLYAKIKSEILADGLSELFVAGSTSRLSLWLEQPTADLGMWIYQQTVYRPPWSANNFVHGLLRTWIDGPGGEELKAGRRVLVCGQVCLGRIPSPGSPCDTCGRTLKSGRTGFCKKPICKGEVRSLDNKCDTCGERWSKPAAPGIDPNMPCPEELRHEPKYYLWFENHRSLEFAWRCHFCGGLFFMKGDGGDPPRPDLLECPACGTENPWDKRSDLMVRIPKHVTRSSSVGSMISESPTNRRPADIRIEGARQGSTVGNVSLTDRVESLRELVKTLGVTDDLLDHIATQRDGPPPTWLKKLSRKEAGTLTNREIDAVVAFVLPYLTEDEEQDDGED